MRAPSGRHRQPATAARIPLVLLVLRCPVVLAVLLAGSAGCGSTAGNHAAPGVLTVSAAASLTAPFRTIGAQFEAAHPGVDVIFTFDGSGTLAAQIREGAPADVFASADEPNMRNVAEAGLVAGAPTPFARNRLAIAVKNGNPHGVTGLADLAGAGTVSLCGADVPCGRYADQVLTRAGVALPTDHVTRAPNAKAALTAVSAGDADAGIVYLTDITGETVDAVAIPDDQNAVADYPVAVVRSSANPEAARAFVDHVTGPQGQAVLRAAGFLPPP